MNKFSDLEAFTAVVESGTFSAAGERLGIAKSVVSRRISQLEQRLGSQLLHRTTRRLSLSDAGKNFYQRAIQILSDLNEAEQSVAEETSDLRGLLKLAAPLSFGLTHLSSCIFDFLSEHPAIELNMDLNDRNVNLVEEGFDMAVRIGELEDSTYLQQHGKPEHPDDLQQHIGLQYNNISYKRQWSYKTAKGKTIIAQPQIRIRANNGEALAAAAIAGMGVTKGPTFILGSLIKAGKLLTILDEYQSPPMGIYAVYPPGRLLPRRIQVFSDFLAGRFGDHPYWDEGLGFI
jgi:DNA-binding transcriptional LysR family regulator